MLSNIDVRQFLRAGATHIGAVVLFIGVIWAVARPHAEDFVRDAIAKEKFATHEELEKQTRALEELQRTVDQQARSLQDQSSQLGIVQNDLGTVKTLQRDTLRAVLKLSEP